MPALFRWLVACVLFTAHTIAPRLCVAGIDVMAGLCTSGLKNIEAVAKVVFQYIGMLKREGVSQWIWEEEKAVSEMQVAPMTYSCTPSGESLLQL